MLSCVKVVPVAPEAQAHSYGRIKHTPTCGIELLYIENTGIVILTPYDKDGNPLAVEIQITPAAMDGLVQVWLNRTSEKQEDTDVN